MLENTSRRFIMVLWFLAITFYTLFILWCLSDNFRIAVLDRVMLRKLNFRIKEGFFKIQIAELGFDYFGDDDIDKKSIYDTLRNEMNKINKDYKFFMCPIDEHIKTCKIFKFIYEDKFNECIETATELEKQYNDLLSRYKDKLN